MSSTSDKYLQRGVSSDKTEVHQAIKHLSKGLYLILFVKLLIMSGNLIAIKHLSFTLMVQVLNLL